MKKNRNNTLNYHLNELRMRLIYSIAVLLTVFAIMFFISNNITAYITRTMITPNNISLHFFDVSEPFMYRMKISFISAIITCLPFLALQLWLYTKPALKKSEKITIFFSFISGLILFYAGFFLGFSIILPASLKTLLSFAPENLNNTINASSFIRFCSYISFGTGTLFNLPVAVFGLTKAGIIDYRIMTSKRKYAIIIIWVISAVITPPDVVSQAMLSVPLMLLYEISIAVSFFSGRNKKNRSVKKINKRTSNN